MMYQANPVIVEAHRIVSRGSRQSDGIPLALENGENVVAPMEMAVRYDPKPGDYYVIQEDGYIYLNPKDVFERKYSPIEE